MELNHKQKRDRMKKLERKGKRISKKSKRSKNDCSKDQDKKLKKLNASSIETSWKVISQSWLAFSKHNISFKDLNSMIMKKRIGEMSDKIFHQNLNYRKQLGYSLLRYNCQAPGNECEWKCNPIPRS